MNTGDPSAAGAPAGAGPNAQAPRLGIRDIRRYRVSDSLSGSLIGFMVVFSPWAFGTTQPATIWTMNLTGYALGALLAVKWFIRRFRGYRPPRWGGEPTPALVKLNSSPGGAHGGDPGVLPHQRAQRPRHLAAGVGAF